MKEEYTAKTKAFIRGNDIFKNKYMNPNTPNTIKAPIFMNGFYEGELSMIEIHKSIVDRVREYLHLFKDENGLVNHAFKEEIERIDKLTNF